MVVSAPENVALFADMSIVKSKFVEDFLGHLEVTEFKRKKRAEEKARKIGRQKINQMFYYPWNELCQYM